MTERKPGAWPKGQRPTANYDIMGGMRNEKGQFVKGFHSTPNTEFKKGIRASPDTEFKKGLVPW